ncbi:hypothetical protein [Microbacterium aerolatum]|uniref:Uncharacterized protein n=1 Tax=Microbacterium aerolatum TaxID=153731 RepID=A0A511AGM9_9MICO|nr:hypothetical protein [Microbacterium aerolatum]GEK85177.1 hypothetical protein MAE01_03530 [Microbacterium aerolatum]GGB28911.1 hypothetical protein GCM10007198_19280 [Microbacterium aerolatum]
MSDHNPNPAQPSDPSRGADAVPPAHSETEPASFATQKFSETSRKRSWKLPAIVAVGAVVVVAAAGGVVYAVTQPTQIERTYEVCGGTKALVKYFEENDWDSGDLMETAAPLYEGVLTVEDDGAALIIQTKSEDIDPLGVTALAMDCVFEELPVPGYVQSNIRAVTASSGRLTEKWDGYDATFGYHPDNGANIVIVKR